MRYSILNLKLGFVLGNLSVLSMFKVKEIAMTFHRLATSNVFSTYNTINLQWVN